MLIQFRVENYKSFDDEQVLSMVAGSTRNNGNHMSDVGGIKVLRTATVFGSNASGKSNLVKAMAAVRNLLVFSIPISPTDYCRVNESNRGRGTSFEFTVSMGDIRYVYGIEVLLSTGEIMSEWFKDMTKNGRGLIIFSREKDIETELDLKNDRMFFDVYKTEAMNAKTVPFLCVLSRVPAGTKNGLEAVHRMLGWFQNSLRIIGPGASTGFRFTRRRDAFTRDVLPAYGTGISEISYRDLDRGNNPVPPELIFSVVRNMNVGDMPPDEPCGVIESMDLGKFPVFMEKDGTAKVKKMMFDHSGKLFEYYEESDGTNRLFDLVPILDPQDGKDLVYVIDELDRSLHPQLTKKFVSDFEKLDVDLRRQLITTTHESRLMDLNLLRRDEMWFIEKKDDISTLYSLEEFNERSDRRIDKAYLEGRYGAVPCFRSVFPDLR